MDAHRRTANIKRTIRSRIGDTITTAGAVTYSVFHSHPWKDPGGIRVDASSQELVAWVETTFAAVGAGRRGATIMQAEIKRRILDEGDANADPQGLEGDAIQDALIEVFSGTVASGRQRGLFHVLDFAIPAAPTDTGECMLCINSRQDIGEPEDVTDIEDVGGGFRRTVIRWRFQLANDVVGGAGFYTG